MRGRGNVARCLLAAAVAGVGAASGCGPETNDLELPPIPFELRDVAADYVQPTGTVPENAQQAIDDAGQRLDIIAQTRIAELITEALAALRIRLADLSLSTDPDGGVDTERATFDARASSSRVCRGWDDAVTTPDTSNGSVQLFAQVATSRLVNQVWGAASACRGRVDVVGEAAVHTYLDGALAIYLLGPLPTSVRDARFIMAFDGTVGTERTGMRAIDFDYAFNQGQIEVRIPVADGVIIGSVGLSGITLRGANGTFGCSRETRTCGAQ
jgi:hypothetical protein